MANYTAADVKKLREETDAPMMECKAALEEADGDYARAKEILREKGKAAAAKRADRTTGAGVVAFASANGRTAGIVLESETDFVSRNPEFVEFAEKAAVAALGDNADAELASIAEQATAKFREKSEVTRRVVLTGEVVTYVHHDRSKGAAVVVEGDVTDALKKLPIQIVALPPLVVEKSQLDQEKLDAELALETKRAMDEGKPENIAKNIAQGRVNKEFIKSVVLLEQPYYADGSKSVSQYLAEEAKGTKVLAFEYLAVGQGA